MLPRQFITSVALLARAAWAAPRLLNTSVLVLDNGLPPMDLLQPSEDLIAAHMELAEEERLYKRNLDTFAPLDVEVYMHVITRTVEGQQNATTEVLAAMMKKMNDVFAAGKISFHLIGTRYLVHERWAQGYEEDEMKAQLRKGTKRTLNLYLVESLQPDPRAPWFVPYGDASCPDELKRKGLAQDGVTIAIETLPGGRATQRNRGGTCLHKLGVWFGLTHTFRFTCDGPGDFVDDTPAELGPSSSCEIRDSCPDQPGKDPIHNFMDWSPDECLKEFTPGQFTRMHSLWNKFRAVDDEPPATREQEPAVPEVANGINRL